MKKISLSIIYFLTNIVAINAQNLYVTAEYGGANGAGMIAKYVTNQRPIPQFTFGDDSLAGYAHDPDFGFVQASNGKLYAVTREGGAHDQGTIFSYNISTNTVEKQMDFEGKQNGGSPAGGLIQAGNGKLYGTTISGGSNNAGVIYSFDPRNYTYSKEFDFDSLNGFKPQGRLLQASNGKLYGVMMQGGCIGNGVIFSFDLLSSTYTKLKEFDRTNGQYPCADLIQGIDGKLYGVTASGGYLDLGVLYSYDISTNTILKLLDFSYSGGGFPSGVVQLDNGVLYGVRSAGGSPAGDIYSFDPSTSRYNLLEEFRDEGLYPTGRLVKVSGSKLFGVTSFGGSCNAGVIFSLETYPDRFFEDYLKIFNKYDGDSPQGSLLLANDGKLYGLTTKGGLNFSNNFRGGGVIFSYTPATRHFKKLVDLAGTKPKKPKGRNPSGSPLQASNGKLYGLTVRGGANDVGVIYSLGIPGLKYTEIHDFDPANGSTPVGSLVQATNGKLYGVTHDGGSNGTGVVFLIDPSTNQYTKLVDFEKNGGSPTGNLIQGANGKLYGNAARYLFSIDPSTNQYTKLPDFGIIPGSSSGNLVQGYIGKLYGLTDRSIYSFDPLSSTYKILKVFNSSPGEPAAEPRGLTEATNGILYGTTKGGGSVGRGIVFSFDPASSTYTTLIIVLGNPYEYIEGALFQASNGKLYGATSGYAGGGGLLFGMGTQIPFTFEGFEEIYLNSLWAGTLLISPWSARSFTEVRECGSFPTYYRDADGDGYGNPDDARCTPTPCYVTNNNDCDDNDNTVHARVTWYRDCDRDGFGDPYHPASFCSGVSPAGYVKNNYDCYDLEGGREPGQVRVRMCHDGWTQCVYVKDTAEKLRLGWTMGLCPLQSCAADETLMCHNGKQECVKTTDVTAKLAEPGGKWSLGPYCSGVPISGSGSGSNRAAQIDIAPMEKSLPTQYSLSNHPNPFAGTSTIKYDLPYDSKVSIKVYDLAGRTVATLVDEYKKAGTYTVNFNADHLSNGSLFYKIIASSKEGQFERTNQMVKIK